MTLCGDDYVNDVLKTETLNNSKHIPSSVAQRFDLGMKRYSVTHLHLHRQRTMQKSLEGTRTG